MEKFREVFQNKFFYVYLVILIGAILIVSFIAINKASREARTNTTTKPAVTQEAVTTDENTTKGEGQTPESTSETTTTVVSPYILPTEKEKYETYRVNPEDEEPWEDIGIGGEEGVDYIINENGEIEVLRTETTEESTTK